MALAAIASVNTIAVAVVVAIAAITKNLLSEKLKKRHSCKHFSKDGANIAAEGLFFIFQFN